MIGSLNLYDDALENCKQIFDLKNKDYGPSWRLFRAVSLTDQMIIKVKKLRTVQDRESMSVQEPLSELFSALVNYSVMGIIQRRVGHIDDVDSNKTPYQKTYDEITSEARTLMIAKNSDYNEAWRDLRLASITDLIFVKLQRIRNMEELDDDQIQSEGIESNLLDIINYAIFALILIKEKE